MLESLKVSRYPLCIEYFKLANESLDRTAGEPMLLGNGHSRVIVTGGNVRLYPQGGQTPLSPNGVPLHCEAPAGERFEAECGDGRAAWTYTAERSPDGRLLVWLPPDKQ